MHRRFREYDPATGHFTQEDPIGLAGGANLYGFANGDPVNFSDPLGLHPIAWLARAAVWLAARSPTIARVLGIGSAAAATAPRLGPEIARTFHGGTYTATRLAADMRVHRIFGGAADQVGRFFTTTPVATTEGAKAALNLPAQNAATHVVETVIPAGTTVYQGLVAGGNATQIFIANPTLGRFGIVTQLPPVPIP